MSNIKWYLWKIECWFRSSAVGKTLFLDVHDFNIWFIVRFRIYKQLTQYHIFMPNGGYIKRYHRLREDGFFKNSDLDLYNHYRKNALTATQVKYLGITVEQLKKMSLEYGWKQ